MNSVASHAVLVITSDRLTDAELSRRVGLEPDRRWTKGEPRGSEPGHGVHPISGIEFSSRLDRSRSPDDHLADLSARLDTHLGAIRELSAALVDEADGAGTVRCWVYVESNELMYGFDLHPRTLAPFVQAECLIGVDISAGVETSDERAAS